MRKLTYIILSFVFLFSTILSAQSDMDNIALGNKNKAIYKNNNIFLEIGLHSGHFYIQGDLDSKLFKGIGSGIYINKRIYKGFILSLDFMYGKSSGISTMPLYFNSFGGSDFPHHPYKYETEGWFPSTQTKYYRGGINIQYDIVDLISTTTKKWSWLFEFGLGLDYNDTRLDLLDSNNDSYHMVQSRLGPNPNHPKDDYDLYTNIKTAYDGVYETASFKKNGLIRLGNDNNLHGSWNIGTGFQYKISKSITIGISHKIIFNDNDYLDGVKEKIHDKNPNNDRIHYTSLSIGNVL